MDHGILLTYGSLLAGVIAIWLNINLFGKIPLWLALAGLSIVLGVVFERAGLLSLSYVMLFGVVTYFHSKKNDLLFFLFTLILSIPLLLHVPFLGFNNYKYLDNIVISDGASPYSLYFNLDKTIAGLLILGFGFNVEAIDIPSMLKKVVINLLVMCLVFLVLTNLLGYVHFEPKIPYFTPIWILTNLFFTCIAEETIFRKLLQQKLYNTLSTTYRSSISILLASVVFGLVHFKGGSIYVIMATLAGLFYGYVYDRTKRIESSILLHFGFNLVHFLFFTYPALVSVT